MSLALLGIPLAVASVWLRVADAAHVPYVAVVLAVLAARFDREGRFVRVTVLTSIVEGLAIGSRASVWPLAALGAAVVTYGVGRAVVHRTWVGCAVSAFLGAWAAGAVVRVLDGVAGPTLPQTLSTAALAGLLAFVAGRRRGMNLAPA
jgi:hypothetical protein